MFSIVGLNVPRLITYPHASGSNQNCRDAIASVADLTSEADGMCMFGAYGHRLKPGHLKQLKNIAGPPFKKKASTPDERLRAAEAFDDMRVWAKRAGQSILHPLQPVGVSVIVSIA